MKHQLDDRGRTVRTWDDSGRLIYAARPNWGVEADQRMGRLPRRLTITVTETLEVES